METKTEEATPQNPVAEETPKVEEDQPEGATPEGTEPEGTVVVTDEKPKEDDRKPEEKDPSELTPEEIKDLQTRAAVSSQNHERAKKAEGKVKELGGFETEVPAETVPSQTEDETVGELQSTVAELQAKDEKREILETYPQLKDIWNDFEEFQNNPDNAGMKPLAAAKVFLSEKGGLDEQPKRKGLEKPTGGPKKPTSTGMSVEDLEKLRKSDGKKYREMLKKGQIKFKK